MSEEVKCPKGKPIEIRFVEIRGESGQSMTTGTYVKMEVNLRLDKKYIEKYRLKKLSIKDLNKIIESRY